MWISRNLILVLAGGYFACRIGLWLLNVVIDSLRPEPKHSHVDTAYHHDCTLCCAEVERSMEVDRYLDRIGH
jgi:hypothetical protein